MKQLSLIPKSSSRSKRTEHGGHITLGRRRRRRPLNIKQPHHLVLRSDFAYAQRMLTRHRPLINRIIQKAKKRFNIKVYELAIVSNHIHLLAKGHSRSDIQNFFRVVAGHIAQEILRQYPVKPGDNPQSGGGSKSAGGAPKAREKENKFWQTRIYSRIVTWGREFIAVKKYVLQNTLEALGLIPYQTRRLRTIKRGVTDTS